MNKKFVVTLSAVCTCVVLVLSCVGCGGEQPEKAGDFPTVAYSIEKGAGNEEFSYTSVPEGVAYLSEDLGYEKASDFLISHFQESSAVEFNKNRFVTKAEEVPVEFDVAFSQEKAELLVLRWSFEKFGTLYPFKDAELVEYERTEDGNSFMAEAGYVYSVCVMWGDCAAEYPIQIIKEK